MQHFESPPWVPVYLTEVYGETYARDWLARAPRVIEELCYRWGFTFLDVAPKSNRSIVARCVDASRKQVALKIVPGKVESFDGEQALSDLDVFPEILHVDVEIGAYVTRWLRGREFLSETNNGMWEFASDVIGQIVRVNAHQVPSVLPFDDWLNEVVAQTLERHTVEPMYPECDLHRQVSIFRSPGQTGLVHGDLAPPNIFVTDQGVRFIDPEPHLAPLECEIARFCVRAERGHRMNDYVELAMRLCPQLDRRLFDEFVIFHCRTYVDYVVAQGRPLGEEHLRYARMTGV